jgi:hypothetical protein
VLSRCVRFSDLVICFHAVPAASSARPVLTRADGIPDDDDYDDGHADNQIGCCDVCPVARRRAKGDPVPELPSPRYRSITINLTRDQYARLQQQAAERTTSVSQLLRVLVLDSLQNQYKERHDRGR